MRTLALVMAGGQGTRLHPLTRDRAKPAVPFGGKYRIIDFVLSNLVNSGIYAIYVLVQWRSQSLIEHLKDGWQFGGMLPDHFVIPVPAQMRMGELWYQGTADAIFQNLNLIDDTKPDLVAVFGADHIYRMDIQQMIEFHMERKAAVTVATLPVSVDEADQFGIVQVDSGLRVSGFVEKPSNPPQMPGAPGRSLASMGNYLFSPEVLREALIEDSINEKSNHDFGRDLIPALINRVPVYAYNFMTNRIRGDAEVNLSYWRDVGTLDAYYEANMDLRDAQPHLNLYNAYWPLRTAYYDQPPAKFVFDENGRRGLALHSVIGEGCIVSGGAVRNSVLGRSVVRAFVQPGRGFGHHGLRGNRAARENSARDYRQERLCSRGRGDRIRPRARPAAIFRQRFGPGRDSQGSQARTVGTVDGASISVSKSQSSIAANRPLRVVTCCGAASLRPTRPMAPRRGQTFRSPLGKPKSTRIQLGLKDRLIFWMLVAVLHALSLLPDFILYKLGIACGLIFHRFDHRHRRIGIRNLEIAFPEKSAAERERILRASYINLGRTGAEYVRLGGFFYRRIARRVTYNRLDVWNELTPRYPGKGALILTAHFGGFELLPMGHALHGFQIGLVHHTQRFLAGDDLVSFIRERAGVQIIRKHTAAREMLRSLKRGEIIGIPLDQNAKRSEAIWVPFFGELAATPSGFDRLAMMAGAPSSRCL